MADVKISALPAATVPLAGTEVLPIVQSATTRQVSVANLTAGRAISASSITNSALTSGRVTYAGASGLLTDSANFTYNGTLLSVSATGSSATTLAQFRQLITGVNTGDARITVGNEVYNPLVIGQNAGSSGFTYGSALDTFFVNSANGSMLFGTNNTVKATLDSSGNLGIGVTPSAWDTTVYKASQIGAGVGVGSVIGRTDGANGAGFALNGYYSTTGWKYIGSSNASWYFQTSGQHQWFNAPSGTAGNAISWTQAMTLNASGSLLVGTTSENPGIGNTDNGVKAGGDLIASSRASNFAAFFNRNTDDGGVVWFGRQGTQVGSISVTTLLTAYNTTSDYRLKENIVPMTGALAKVAQLKPVTYKWKLNGSDGQGFIAHELAEVVPDCVTGEKDAVDEDGEPVYQGIDTSQLVATLVSAIQELKAEFDAYKATHP